MSPDSPTFTLRNVRILEQDGAFSEETHVLVEEGVVAERYGRVAPGYVFDAIVLDRDPSDMAVFREKRTAREVFKAGVACAPPPSLSPAPSRRRPCRETR